MDAMPGAVAVPVWVYDDRHESMRAAATSSRHAGSLWSVVAERIMAMPSDWPEVDRWWERPQRKCINILGGHGTILGMAFALVDARVRALFLGIDFFQRSIVRHHSFARFVRKPLQRGKSRLVYLGLHLREAVAKEPAEGGLPFRPWSSHC